MSIKTYNSLSENIMKEVLELERICKEDDHLNGSVFLDKSLNFNHDLRSIFLHYENSELISMLSMFVPKQHEAEISAFTLPKYRGNGYFTGLLSKAVEELRKYNVPDILFVCEFQSNAGKQAIEALNAKYGFTEYSMRLNKSGYVPRDGHRLVLIKPDLKDLDKIVELNIRTFGDSYEDSKSWVEKCFESQTREQFLGVLDEKIIGMGSTNMEGDVVSICGLGVEPEYRNQGYGNELLHLIVDRLWQRGKTEITIDVNSDNTNALGLYKKFGFQIEVAYEYYRKKVDEIHA